MLEIIVYSVFVLAFGGVVYHHKRKSDKFHSSIDATWDTTILSFVERNGLSGIDMNFKPTTNVKKKSSAKEFIKFIGSNIPKGYDFIDASFEKGYAFGPHDHQYSSKFVYVLSGKIKIVYCNNTPNNCNKCAGDCLLFTGNAPQADLTEKILCAEEWLYTGSGVYHTFEAMEDSRCIMITLPPISRGVL